MFYYLVGTKEWKGHISLYVTEHSVDVSTIDPQWTSSGVTDYEWKHLAFDTNVEETFVVS